MEPVLCHLRSGCLLLRNYLKAVEGAMIDTTMAAEAFSIMKRLWQIRSAIYFVLDLLSGYRQLNYVAGLIN